MSAALANLTPEQLAITPAGIPPPGVIPNLIDPPSRGWVLILAGTLLMALMLLFVSLRFYVKLSIVKKTTWDDYTCAIAVFGSICYYIICIYAATAGKYGTHVWDVSVADFLSKKVIIAGYLTNFFTTLVWPFAKLSFFIFYYRLFYPMVWLRRMVVFGAFVNVAFYFSILVVTLYYTTPAPGQSWEEDFLSPRYGKTLNTAVPIASGSLVIDVYLFLLPVFGIWNLQLSLRKKFGVMIVFGTGLVACIASSLGIYYKVKLDADSVDFLYSVLPVQVVALAEMTLGISASCMPVLKKLAPTDDSISARFRLSQPWASLASMRSSKNQSVTTSQVSNDEYSWSNKAKIPSTQKSYFELTSPSTVKTTIKNNVSRVSSGAGADEAEGIHVNHIVRQDYSSYESFKAHESPV